MNDPYHPVTRDLEGKPANIWRANVTAKQVLLKKQLTKAEQRLHTLVNNGTVKLPKPWDQMSDAERCAWSAQMARKRRNRTKKSRKKRGIRGIGKSVRARVLQRDKYQCLKCDEANPDKLTMDHIDPKAERSKMNRVDNLQTLCNKCNSAKGMSVIDYRKPIW